MVCSVDRLAIYCRLSSAYETVKPQLSVRIQSEQRIHLNLIMKKTHIKPFIGTPFTIECNDVENAPGIWSSTKVSIYRGDLLIGEYLRNYSNFAPLTFYPFLIDTEWYALYSADYTATRVMKLHEDRIEDWCGEIGNSTGFCPVEFFVPRYNVYTDEQNIMCYKIDNELLSIDESAIDKSLPKCVETIYCNFGFLCGCIWGDDVNWKIRYIDLSKIALKELIITEKFGYCQMPNSMTLRQCINMEYWEPTHNWISLTRVEHINLETDERH